MLRNTAPFFLTCIILCISTASTANDDDSYQFTVLADFSSTPAGQCVPVSVTVTQTAAQLLRLTWRTRKNMHDLQADGQLIHLDSNTRWQWQIPQDGGKLEYCLDIDNHRGERYDARLTDDWAWLRADDLFPAARAVTSGLAKSVTRLHLKLPPDWTAATPFERHSRRYYRYTITDPKRRFDRPTGWLLLGKLGVRRDRIADTAVTVAAPLNQGARRLDLISLLGFTLPTMREWLPTLPDRLLITLLSDQTWRGGLSAPRSLYLHADRAYISENSTSPLLHELVHVGLQKSSAADWIDEGLAEYLGLLILNESGGITDERFAAAIQWQTDWAERENGTLKPEHSSAADTARAVSLFAMLHTEMGNQPFKQLIADIAGMDKRLTPAQLHTMATEIHGQPLYSLSGI